MPDDSMLKRQQDRTQQLKFIKAQLTQDNPIEALYINIEEQTRAYFGLILLGIIMVAYMIIY